MKRAHLIVAATALWASAALAQGGPARSPKLVACEAQAAGKQLVGYARELFVSECASASAPARAVAKPAVGTAAAAAPGKGELDRSNEQRRREMDEQHDRWTKSANRAMGSICAGCGKVEGARPATAKRRAPRRRHPDSDDGGAYESRDD
jgi:hypothetical protein